MDAQSRDERGNPKYPSVKVIFAIDALYGAVGYEGILEHVGVMPLLRVADRLDNPQFALSGNWDLRDGEQIIPQTWIKKPDGTNAYPRRYAQRLRGLVYHLAYDGQPMPNLSTDMRAWLASLPLRWGHSSLGYLAGELAEQESRRLIG